MSPGVDSFGGLRDSGALAGLAGLDEIERAQALVPHASLRRFFRVWPRGGGTRVLLVYPEGEPDGVERYLRTARWFAHAGAPVPRVHARGDRCLLLQDGGDALLDRHPESPAARQRAYRRATDIVLEVQRYGRREPLPNPGWQLDAHRLLAELDFMEEHALQGWLAVDRGADARRRAFSELAEEVAALPVAACHRDYHARNLLLHRDALLVLDFQDVMEGPYLYDLASLLLDNYCDVPASVAAMALSRFWHATPRQGASCRGRSPETPRGLPPHGRRAFALVGLQRSLKALGTFGFQIHERGNSHYEEFVPRTWRYARAAMVGLGRDDLLRDLEALQVAAA